MPGTTQGTNGRKFSVENSQTILSRCLLSARVSKIRVTDASGAYRVIYVARLEAAVYVLHAFRKKTQTTSMHDIDTAKLRFAQISRGAK